MFAIYCEFVGKYGFVLGDVDVDVDVGVVLFVGYGARVCGTSVNSSQLSDQQQIVEGVIR